MTDPSEVFYEEDIMFKEIYYLPSMASNIPDKFVDIVCDLSPEDLKNIFNTSERDMVERCGHDYDDGSETIKEEDEEEYLKLPDLANWAKQDIIKEIIMEQVMIGFLAVVNTPVKKYDEDGDEDGIGSTYSWGYFNETRIYGNTIEEITEKSVEWVKSLQEKWKLETREKNNE